MTKIEELKSVLMETAKQDRRTYGRVGFRFLLMSCLVFIFFMVMSVSVVAYILKWAPLAIAITLVVSLIAVIKLVPIFLDEREARRQPYKKSVIDAVNETAADFFVPLLVEALKLMEDGFFQVPVIEEGTWIYELIFKIKNIGFVKFSDSYWRKNYSAASLQLLQDWDLNPFFIKAKSGTHVVRQISITEKDNGQIDIIIDHDYSGNSQKSVKSVSTRIPVVSPLVAGQI